MYHLIDDLNKQMPPLFFLQAKGLLNSNFVLMNLMFNEPYV